MKKFGAIPKNKRFTPPEPTRGGNTSAFEKKKEQPLTGKVQNMKAAQGEERLARSIEKGITKGIVREHRFRWTTLKRGTVGYKELDELVFLMNGRVVAISVKGNSFVHRGDAAHEQDKINELLQMVALRNLGYAVARIDSIADTELATQEMADKAARKLGVYR
jgi:multidrug efflux pump subunit AcrA (membrane-fusion protein)